MYVQGPLNNHKTWQGTNVTVFEVGMYQLEMFNWMFNLQYHSRVQELLPRHKCFYLHRFVLLGLPSGRRISPFRWSSIKVKVKFKASYYVIVSYN